MMMENPHKAKNLLAMAPRTMEREAKLLEIEREAIANFVGQLDDLASALGMLRFGDYMGWRVLVLIHNKRTIRKYEEILNIKVREFFPEEGSQSHRSIGYKVAKQLGKFWKAVSGEVPIENRRGISAELDDKILE
jgi:hypothetical protein